jgi:hypothetical protein
MKDRNAQTFAIGFSLVFVTFIFLGIWYILSDIHSFALSLVIGAGLGYSLATMLFLFWQARKNK